MTQKEAQELLRRYRQGLTSPEEESLLIRWAELRENTSGPQWAEEDKEAFFRLQARQISLKTGIDLVEAASDPIRRPTIQRYRWMAAASVLLVLSAIYLIYPKRPLAPRGNEKNSQVTAEIHPGTDKAILTLSDGRRVALGNSGESVITDGDVQIKTNNAELIYSNTDIVVLNTMTTPRGGQYKLTLPDGSRVWLNAESSITFPTAFKTNERSVDITGEVYFEVVRNTLRPFIVNNRAESIRVLGTSFNINAYSDEHAVKTTLVEGSVKIGGSVMKPGEAYTNGKIIKEDVEGAIAWKNGFFHFNKSDLPTVMRQLSRWYDVEIEYAGEVPKRSFSGEIGRELSLDLVLKGLTITRVKYELKNRNKIIIQP